MTTADAAADILCDLIGFDSVSANSNLPIIAYIENMLAGHGVASRRIPSADGTKASLLATIGNPAEPGIVLSGHTDVVPAEGQAWTVPPFGATLRDGRIYGRGATDMKGFLAVVLAHVPAFVGARGVAPVHLAFSYDEEVGCRGAPDLVAEIARLPARPALAIIGEPTRMHVAHAHKGKLARRVTITGRTGHSAMPHRAANAVESAAAIACALRALARDEAATASDTLFDPPFTTVHLGSIHGGGAVNLVPDRAVLEFEIRHAARRDPAAILARLEDVIAAERQVLQAVASEADITSEELSNYPGLETDAASAEARIVARLAGDTHAPGTVSFGTEAGIFAGAGIPSLVCGPGDMARGHKADEWIGLDELAAAGEMMERVARLIRRPSTEWMDA